ncbi:hypothetical protein CMO89_04180 [Candidatus Woesearchaeota archaeon]|nr:hypothetical protein [Candidatus Woesearchaeota archaeon]
MRYKNIFLIMVGLLVMAGVSEVSEGAIEGINVTLDVVMVDNETGGYLGPNYPFNITIRPLDGVYYLNNGTYFFNFTLINLNETYNITSINITMDSGFLWGYGNWSGFSDGVYAANPVDFNFTNISNEQHVLSWNRSAAPFITNGTAAGTCTNTTTWFAFNVTIGQNNNLDGFHNFTIIAGYNDTYETYTAFNLDFNISIDNTLPTFSTAVTNGTGIAGASTNTSINITFSEVIWMDSLTVKSFYMTYGGVNYTAAALLTQNSTNTTLIFHNLIGANGTPTVYLNSTDAVHNISDYAGNIAYGNTTGVGSVTPTDGIKPTLRTFNLSYNYSNRYLILRFDEPVEATFLEGIHLVMNNSVAGTTDYLVLNAQNESVTYNQAFNYSNITLSTAHRDTILGWTMNASSPTLNISLLEGAFNDTSDNMINAVVNQSLNEFELDITRPDLTSAAYDHATRTINFTFSEKMYPNRSATDTFLINVFIANESNSSNTSVKKISLGGALVNVMENTTTIQINLTGEQNANLSSWRTDTLYVWTHNLTFGDLAGNNMTQLSNTTALGWLNSSTYTPDVVTPNVFTAISLNDTTPTKAGNVTFTVTFNEYMDWSNTSTINVTLHPIDNTTTIVVLGKWENETVWNGSYLIDHAFKTDVMDGLTIINVSGARDIGYNAMAANISNNFTIDTTLPTLLMVWYNDTGFDYNESTGEQGGQGGQNFLILKFSENVTTDYVNSNTTTNISNLIYLTNGSNTSGSFDGNDTADQGAVWLRDQTQHNKMNFAISSNMTIWLRGIFNGSGKVQGIILANGSTSITDPAGNPISNRSGPLDIYDHAMVWTADNNGEILWNGFSLPHDVNSTPTWKALNDSGQISVVYTYNGTAWITATSTSNDFIPLRGYLVKITGVTKNNTIDVPIQTDLMGSPEPDSWSQYTTSVKVDDGAYSLIGVNGYLDDAASADQRATGKFLNSIGGSGDGSEVGLITYADTLEDIGTAAAIVSDKLIPYNAYWIWANNKADSSYYTFNGYADKNLI